MVPLLVGELGFLEVRSALDFCWGVDRGAGLLFMFFFNAFCFEHPGAEITFEVTALIYVCPGLLCALSPWNTFPRMEHGISCSGRRVLDGVAFFSPSLLGSLQSVPSSEAFSVSAGRGA